MKTLKQLQVEHVLRHVAKRDEKGNHCFRNSL